MTDEQGEEESVVIVRRADPAQSPTIIMQAFDRMDEADKTRLERLGVGMIVVAGGIPLIAGVWYNLSYAYWAFSAGIATLGVTFCFPALGVMLGDRLLRLAGRLPLFRGRRGNNGDKN